MSLLLGGPWVPRRLALAAIYLMVGVIALVLVGLRFDEPAGVAVLDWADFTPASPDGAPLPDASAVTVRLPTLCTMPDRANNCLGVYRLHVAVPEPVDELWAIYLPAFLSRVQVSLNGVPIADSKPVYPPTGQTATVPFLVVVTPSLLRQGDNVVDVRLDSRTLAAGLLSPIYAGPERLLRPAFSQRNLLFSTYPKILVGVQFTFALFMLAIWWVRPEERTMLLLGAMLTLNSVSMFPLIAPDLPFPEMVFRLCNQALFWQTALILPFAYHFARRRPPIDARWFVVPPAAATIGFLTLPTPAAIQIAASFAVPSLIVMVALACPVLLSGALRLRDDTGHLLLAGLFAALGLYVRDALVMHGQISPEPGLLSRFACPIVLLPVSAVLMYRFARVLRAYADFSAHLLAEIAAAEEALRASFRREETQLRANILRVERERLTHDLHDGVAGQLASIISLCELTQADSGRGISKVGQAARRALTDLRLTIDALEDLGDNLGMMLAMFRERMQPMLRAQGITLHWRMAPLPNVAGLTSRSVLTIFRILQEATNNAVKHSGCCDLSIVAIPSPALAGGVRLTISDRGPGGAADRPGSYGLANMRRRSEAIGARFAIESGSEGTQVVIDLPPRLRDSPDGA